MVALYLDLDGTLVDVKRRHYLAYARAAATVGEGPVPLRDYWARRRRGASTMELAPADEERRATFLETWLAEVESAENLRLDTMIPGARRALSELGGRYELALVTLRRDWGSLMEQLSWLGLMESFSAVYSRGWSEGCNSTKAYLIELAGIELDERSLVVGDSEEDVRAARQVGLGCVSVTSGVRGRRYLAELAPDHLLSSVAGLPDLLSRPDGRPSGRNDANGAKP
jgi:phosphoglycolate phosphatase-like HAD superfamily hydrolase